MLRDNSPDGKKTTRFVPRPANLSAETRRDRVVIRTRRAPVILDQIVYWISVVATAFLLLFAAWAAIVALFMLDPKP